MLATGNLYIRQRGKGRREVLKRIIDIVVSLMGLIVLSPVFVVVAFLVRCCIGRPIIFRQERPGSKEKLFTLLKFRTMKNSRDSENSLLPDEQRMTRLGEFLRRASLDELPELWNVLKGDISLVGPRPLLTEYLPLYSEEQRRRHDAKPGMTGWAQVNGRNAISWEEKFSYDVWYVDNWSLWLDLKILMMTVVKVVAGDGITADGHVSMPKFEGSGENSHKDAKDAKGGE